MADLYQQSTSTGTISSWKRANRIEIANPVGGTPSVVFSEEIATSLPGGSIAITPSTSLTNVPSDMTVTFTLVDPNTGPTTSTMTFGQLYNAIYSYYLFLAAQRDAAVAAAAAAAPGTGL